MTANQIIDFARIAHLRELNAELAKTKARLRGIEQERDALMSHFNVALVALHDFCQLADGEPFRIIDGWNVVLRNRNVAKLGSSEVSKLKGEFLKERGAECPVAAISEKECGSAPVRECRLCAAGRRLSCRTPARLPDRLTAGCRAPV